MHIILSVLGGLIAISYLVRWLRDEGFSLSSLNPAAWRRRRAWQKQYHTNPLYSLTDPVQIAAVLLVATAQADGAMALEEKQTLLSMFENDLQRSAKDASGLLTSSVFLLRSGENLSAEMHKLLAPCGDKFTAQHAEFTLNLMQRLAAVNDQPSVAQQALIDSAKAHFQQRHPATGTWGEST